MGPKRRYPAVAMPATSTIIIGDCYHVRDNDTNELQYRHFLAQEAHTERHREQTARRACAQTGK
jgi:hypothetical protein